MYDESSGAPDEPRTPPTVDYEWRPPSHPSYIEMDGKEDQVNQDPIRVRVRQEPGGKPSYYSYHDDGEPTQQSEQENT